MTPLQAFLYAAALLVLALVAIGLVAWLEAPVVVATEPDGSRGLLPDDWQP